ncbi:hypothetical protein BESB_058470 [Besnoitia besnoiti]|uniref:Uncharacterized protein n=1 Tax=Besnoitia besnoiti TaxID=94643 RepID=A0A2A9MHS4_BESBE|nr:hypothetical protein BESB_058470 [Besnoitia besnoiti]PFH34960.1 hypothetical protein BESB_058470 [Besnoitia besnoiti]
MRMRRLARLFAAAAASATGAGSEEQHDVELSRVGLGESESLFSEFAWVRGDSTAPESRQFDAELSAYLLLVEDASLPGGHVAVANLSSASAEHLFASENAIREGDWLRLRNFKWGATRLHDPLFGRIYFSVQPSRSDLARITRLPPFALDAVRAQQELDRALQALMEDDEIPRDASDPKRTRELPPAESEGEADTARRRRTAAERNPRAGLEAAPEREEEIEECAAAEAPEEAAGRDEAEDDSSPLSGGCAPHTRFELFVPQELLDAHGSRVPVYERIDSLVASSSRPASSARRSREGPFLLKAMHVLGLCAAPLAAEASLESGATVDIADPRTWVVVQCLLCRTSRRLSARRPRPPGGEDATGRRAAAARAAHHGRNARGKRAAQEAARRSDEETTDDHEEVLWCPTCKHRDSAMLVVMYDFHLHLADANGTSLVVQVKDAVGRRFRCASERGISPFFAATDRGAQELLQAVLRGLVSEAEQEEESSRPRERKRGLSSPQKRRGRASASSADGAKDDAEADAEADAAGGAKSDQEGGDGAYLIGSSSSSEEEEGEIQTQSLVGRKYMRRRKHLKAGLAGSRGGEACSGPSAPSEQENSKQSHAPRAHREREEEENQKKKRGLGRHDLLVVRRWAEEAAESDRVFENSGAATWVVTGAEIRRA